MAEQGLCDIRVLGNGKKVACARAGGESGEVAAALRALVLQEPDLSILDLTHLPLHTIRTHPVATTIFIFLIRSIRTDNKNQVIVNDNDVTSLRGKVSGVFFDNIRKSIGEGVELSDFQMKLRLCDFLNAEKLTSSIIGNVGSMPEERTVNDLTKSISAFEAGQSSACERGQMIKAAKQLIRKLKASNTKHAARKASAKTQERSESPNEAPSKAEEKDCAEEAGSGVDQKSFPKGSLKQKKCYICKQAFFLPKKNKRDEISNTYMRLCRSCGELNYEMRNQKADLTHKYAVVTGGRIKIGFELVLKLLRDGCHVITTTRFPHDASKRYAEQNDFADWKSRLHVYALDLKDIPGIYRFVAFVKERFPHLDVLVNNAAQTIRRPMDFFRHLMDYECIPRDHVPELQRHVLVQQQALNYGYFKQQLAAAASSSQPGVVSDHQTEPSSQPNIDADDHAERPMQPRVVTTDTTEPLTQASVVDVTDDHAEPPPKRIRAQAEHEGDMELSCHVSENSDTRHIRTDNKTQADQAIKRSLSLDAGSCYDTELVSNRQPSTSTGKFHTSCWNRDVIIHTGSAFSSMSRYFPRGATDADGQQLDLRRKNSWRMVLEDVPVSEVVEVLVVNVIAPFLLSKELKGLLCRSPAERRFIVNVSAMEGQFNRKAKTKFHPHTNMGKAALNMLTRTAALGYAERRVYMTAVDTGWVTDERPFYIARHEQRVKGFVLPLDSVDGAARVYHPIVHGLRSPTPHYAVFLKDYAVYPW